jgi:uncharacterized protein (UPF0335 family)
MNEPVEHWRTMFIERLHKLEAALENARSDIIEIKTSNAVAATDAKARQDTLSRVESDNKDLARLVRDIDKTLDNPPGQEELEKRIKTIEDWQHDITGKFAIIGFLVTALTSIATALAIKFLSN